MLAGMAIPWGHQAWPWRQARAREADALPGLRKELDATAGRAEGLQQRSEQLEARSWLAHYVCQGCLPPVVRQHECSGGEPSMRCGVGAAECLRVKTFAAGHAMREALYAL